MRPPKFFCENCKREVSVKDKVCPGCGRFFSDVRCPKCGFTGKGDLFYAGCPGCGYLRPAFKGKKEAGAEVEIPESRTKESEHSAGERKPLPPWFFFAVTIGLGIVLSMLVYLYITM